MFHGRSSPGHSVLPETGFEKGGNAPSQILNTEPLISLRRAHQEFRRVTNADWKRVLPFGEVISDRWEKARFLGFGADASIYDSACVFGNVTVGRRTWIGPNCVLDGSGQLTIGDTCSISAGVQIYSHDTVEWAITGGVAPYRYKPTSVGNCVYIGPGTVLAAGSDIGDHCVIGALSFVNGSLPPFSFAVGAPARVIGRIIIAGDGRAEIEVFDRSEASK
jgi:acetyltransferase-like isoleucine patch superfamily enzyme